MPAYDEYIEFRLYKGEEYDQKYQRWQDGKRHAYMTEADALEWVRSILQRQQKDMKDISSEHQEQKQEQKAKEALQAASHVPEIHEERDMQTMLSLLRSTSRGVT